MLLEKDIEICLKASLFIKISKRNANSMEEEVKEEPKRVIAAVHQTTYLRDTLKRPILGQVFRGDPWLRVWLRLCLLSVSPLD